MAFSDTFPHRPRYSIGSTRVAFPKLLCAFLSLNLRIKPVKYINVGPKRAVLVVFKLLVFFGGYFIKWTKSQHWEYQGWIPQALARIFNPQYALKTSEIHEFGPENCYFWWFLVVFLGTFLGGPIYSIRSTRVEFPKLWRAFFTLDMLIKPVRYMNLGPKSAIFGGFRWFFWVRF